MNFNDLCQYSILLFISDYIRNKIKKLIKGNTLKSPIFFSDFLPFNPLRHAHFDKLNASQCVA